MLWWTMAAAAPITSEEVVLGIEGPGAWRDDTFVASAMFEALHPCNDEDRCIESVPVWFVAGLDGTVRVFRKADPPTFGPGVDVDGSKLPDHARRAAAAYPGPEALNVLVPTPLGAPVGDCQSLSRAGFNDDRLELHLGGGHIPFFGEIVYQPGGDEPIRWRLETRPTDETEAPLAVASGAMPARFHMYHEPAYTIETTWDAACRVAVTAGTRADYGFRLTRFHADRRIALADLQTGRRVEVGADTVSVQILAPEGVATAPVVTALRSRGWYGITTAAALAKRERSVVYYRPEAARSARLLAEQLPGGATVEPLTWEAPTPLVVALAAAQKP